MAKLPSDLAQYFADRERVAALYRDLPRGSQTQASYALRTSATMISLVLTGKYVDQSLLSKLETWALTTQAELENLVPA